MINLVKHLANLFGCDEKTMYYKLELTLLEQLVHESSLGWVLPKKTTNFSSQSDFSPFPDRSLDTLIPLLTMEKQKEKESQTGKNQMFNSFGDVKDKISWPNRSELSFMRSIAGIASMELHNSIFLDYHLWWGADESTRQTQFKELYAANCYSYALRRFGISKDWLLKVLCLNAKLAVEQDGIGLEMAKLLSIFIGTMLVIKCTREKANEVQSCLANKKWKRVDLERVVLFTRGYGKKVNVVYYGLMAMVRDGRFSERVLVGLGRANGMPTNFVDDINFDSHKIELPLDMLGGGDEMEMEGEKERKRMELVRQDEKNRFLRKGEREDLFVVKLKSNWLMVEDLFSAAELAALSPSRFSDCQLLVTPVLFRDDRSFAQLGDRLNQNLVSRIASLMESCKVELNVDLLLNREDRRREDFKR